MRVPADLLRALAIWSIRNQPCRRDTRPTATETKMLVASHCRGQGYFLRKRSSRTTSPPPPLVGFSALLAATGTGGLADERFFLLFAVVGSCTFAGAGRSSPSVTSSNCRPN